MEGYHGRCPVADDGVEIDESNETPIMLFRVGELTGKQVETSKKVFIYIQPSEIEALLRVYDVPREDWGEVMARVLLLQDISNEMRPPKAPPPFGRHPPYRTRA